MRAHIVPHNWVDNCDTEHFIAVHKLDIGIWLCHELEMKWKASSDESVATVTIRNRQASLRWTTNRVQLCLPGWFGVFLHNIFIILPDYGDAFIYLFISAGKAVVINLYWSLYMLKFTMILSQGCNRHHFKWKAEFLRDRFSHGLLQNLGELLSALPPALCRHTAADSGVVRSDLHQGENKIRQSGSTGADSRSICLAASLMTACKHS